jgi:cob(I)alamin adenosyltransferase
VDAAATPRYPKALAIVGDSVRRANSCGHSMVKLNVIYTRTGDKGETGLGDGSRRSKSDARVAAMGDVDETNCAIGLAVLAVRHSSDAADLAIEPALTRIQNDLFDLGADLCLPRQPDEKPGSVLRVAPSQVKALEHAIDALNEKLHPLRSFVLPGGTPAAAALHQARAICRRAERVMVALAAIEGEEVGEAALAYINRLSDYLFVAARAANDFGMSDVLWSPGANQSKSPDQTEDDE